MLCFVLYGHKELCCVELSHCGLLALLTVYSQRARVLTIQDHSNPLILQATAFLRKRVHVEEYMLQRLFGAEYKAYARTRPICIPSVSGLIPFDQGIVCSAESLAQCVT